MTQKPNNSFDEDEYGHINLPDDVNGDAKAATPIAPPIVATPVDDDEEPDEAALAAEEEVVIDEDLSDIADVNPDGAESLEALADEEEKEAEDDYYKTFNTDDE